MTKHWPGDRIEFGGYLGTVISYINDRVLIKFDVATEPMSYPSNVVLNPVEPNRYDLEPIE